ncbi:MAG: GNAT family N-acetyltransferase [Candidatus Saccharibacteria bacterium]
MDKVIRLATINDAVAIADTKIDAWRSAYRFMVPDALLESLSMQKALPKAKKWISNPPLNGRLYVFCDNGIVVGHAFFAPPTKISVDVGELVFIYVKTAYQGLGYGSSLVDKGLSYIKDLGCHSVSLWVLTKNHKTRRFYEKLGWKNSGKIRIHNKNGYKLHETRYTISI